MTTDDLHMVLLRESDAIKSRLDKLNGKVAEHEERITGLRINAAYWAGGCVVLASIIGWLTR